MTGKQATTVFLLILAAIALYFCFLIAKPFLSPVLSAIVIAIVFYPIHARIQMQIRSRNTSALCSTILVLLLLVIPALALGIVVSREATQLYQWLSAKSAEQGGWNPTATHAVERVLAWIGQYVDLSALNLRSAMLRWLEQTSRFLISLGASLLGNVLSLASDSAIALFTLFFLFREGRSIQQKTAALLPLDAVQVERLLTGISKTVVANVYGSAAVGLAQGCLTSLAFWVLGLPSPILWGLATALFSLIPVIGSAVVWGPAGLILILSGHWWKGLLLLAWGAAIVGQVDVLVRPYVIGERVKTHTLLVFFALLGGLKAFGAIGLFIGPVVLSVTLVIFDMLREANLPWLSLQAAEDLEPPATEK